MAMSLECRLSLRWQAKLPLLLTSLTYIPVGKACTPATPLVTNWIWKRCKSSTRLRERKTGVCV